MVDRPLIVQCVVGSITCGGPIEQFLVPANAPRLEYQREWYAMVHIKEPLMLMGKSSQCSDFPCSLSGPLL